MRLLRNHGVQQHGHTEAGDTCGSAQSPATSAITVAVLTGGADRHYAVGLATALIAKGVHLDFIGSDEIDDPQLHAISAVNFLNLRGSQRRDVSFMAKAVRVCIYYLRLMRYASTARPKVFHILWNNKIQFFDRTLLMAYYKMLGKRITLTAHNVNAGRRDSKDTLLNRLTLRAQYHLADHIFVHTEKMRRELCEGFGVSEIKVTIIPYGINNAVPDTALTPEEAKQRLGLKMNEKTLLFFGNIAPYKGLEYLIGAFERIVTAGGDYRLMIAGGPVKDTEKYWDGIQQTIAHSVGRRRIIERGEFIPDDETELYFKAADVLILPYTYIFQSGVLFLGYSFGLPVIAADVGSLREDVLEGETGFVCRPKDAGHLAQTIETYFASELFGKLKSRRQQIREYARKRHSWATVAQITCNVYAKLLGN